MSNKRVILAITPTMQYQATSQQHTHVQENVRSNDGYLTQSADHQGSFIYDNSSFPYPNELTTTLQQGYSVYQTEQLPGQNTISETCVLEINKPQPPVTTKAVTNELEMALQAIVEGTVQGKHTTPKNTIRTPSKPISEEAVRYTTRPSISATPPKGQRLAKSPGKVISHRDRSYVQQNNKDESKGSGSDCSTAKSATPTATSIKKRGHTESEKTHNSGREKSQSAKRGRESSHHHREENSNEIKRSGAFARSPSRPMSVPRSVASEEILGGESVHPTPTTVEQLNNEVFRKVLSDKGEQQIPQEVDNTSSVMTSTSRVRKTIQNPIKVVTWESLERTHLEKGLQGTDLARETIKAVIRHCKSSKSASSVILYITHVKAEPTVCSDIRHRIQVQTKDYLLCSGESYFGYAYEDLSMGEPREAESRTSESLHLALYEEGSLGNEHSLDNVFRSALRELVDEIHTYNIEGSSGLDNPVFISGRYLELRLIQKIRQYYMELRRKDIIRSIVPMNAEDLCCELQEFVKDNASTPYLRRLIGLYGITHTNFDDIAEERICTPQKMRVWTTIQGQRDVNMQIQSHIFAVATKAKKKWMNMSEEEKSNSALSYLLANKYMDTSEPFLQSHDNFLSAVLRASELMAWMCFGLTINAKIGCLVMADSFMKKKVEDRTNTLDRSICWNYPLAAIYRREQPMIQRRLKITKSLDHYRAINLEDCI